MHETKFVWKGITWRVRYNNGRPDYKDAAHLGGPWSDAAFCIRNKSIDNSFRRKLKSAVMLLIQWQIANGVH